MEISALAIRRILARSWISTFDTHASIDPVTAYWSKMSILILASGSGTLAQSLIDAQFDIKAIVSDVADAEVLNRGKKAGISTQVISFRALPPGPSNSDG